MRGILLAAGAAVGLGVIVATTRNARAASRELVVPNRGAPAPRGTVGRLLPLAAARVSPNGGFRAPRASPQQGRCLTYPCTHWGVDLVPASHYQSLPIEAHWWVRAPEDLVVDVVALDNVSPPLSGYGPAAVLARGRSGAWHIFGHLDPSSLGTLTKGHAIEAGHTFARVSDAVSPPHVHWEPRRWRTEGPAARELRHEVGRGDIVIDPDAWLRGAA